MLLPTCQRLSAAVSIALLCGVNASVAAEPQAKLYARFEHQGKIRHGVLEGDKLRCIEGDLLGARQPTAETIPLAEAKLLAPVVPPKVLAVGLNYRSHLGERPVPQAPEIFFKLPTSVVGPLDPIVLPRDATDVHYEAELVIVIGKRGRDVPVEQAGQYVLGVTCGNDVSERKWQKGDLQWWRAKGSDTFGPCGPYLAVGVNYDDLMLTLNHNGEIKQQESTSDLIHPVASIVSWISRFVTLEPGDLVFTGTPGKTQAMAEGDVVEVGLEGVGVLRNPVVRER